MQCVPESCTNHSIFVQYTERRSVRPLLLKMSFFIVLLLFLPLSALAQCPEGYEESANFLGEVFYTHISKLVDYALLKT